MTDLLLFTAFMGSLSLVFFLLSLLADRFPLGSDDGLDWDDLAAEDERAAWEAEVARWDRCRAQARTGRHLRIVASEGVLR
jgi:hypothetical protein